MIVLYYLIIIICFIALNNKTNFKIYRKWKGGSWYLHFNWFRPDEWDRWPHGSVIDEEHYKKK